MPQAFNQGLVGAAGAAPAAIGGALLQGQEQQAEPAVEDKTAELEAKAAMESEKRQTELQTKQMESETAIGVATIQGQSQLANTKLAGENQLKVAKAKPKVKPAARKSA